MCQCNKLIHTDQREATSFPTPTGLYIRMTSTRLLLATWCTARPALSPHSVTNTTASSWLFFFLSFKTIQLSIAWQRNIAALLRKIPLAERAPDAPRTTDDKRLKSAKRRQSEGVCSASLAHVSSQAIPVCDAERSIEHRCGCVCVSVFSSLSLPLCRLCVCVLLSLPPSLPPAIAAVVAATATQGPVLHACRRSPKAIRLNAAIIGRSSLISLWARCSRISTVE